MVKWSDKMSHFTTITLEVKVLFQSHNSDRLLAARGRNYGFIAAHTQRGETPARIKWLSVRKTKSHSQIKWTVFNIVLNTLSNHWKKTKHCICHLPVVILNTVGVVVVIRDERRSL